MTPEQKAAFIISQSACAMAKAGAMAAVNIACMATHEMPAYSQKDFDDVFSEFIIDRDRVLTLFKEPAPGGSNG